jgi:hypothetical protein
MPYALTVDVDQPVWGGKPQRRVAGEHQPLGVGVYVGHRGAVSWHEPATGVALGLLPVAGLTELRRTLP